VPARAGAGVRQDFVAPFGGVGAPGGYGILSIIATPTHGSAGLQCPGERPIATPTIQQTPAVLTACQDDAPWVFGGSLRLRWSQQDAVVVISVPGPTDSHQRLLIAMPTTCTLSDPQGADPNSLAGSGASHTSSHTAEGA
jgi:hypothetical protein